MKAYEFDQFLVRSIRFLSVANRFPGNFVDYSAFTVSPNRLGNGGLGQCVWVHRLD